MKNLLIPGAASKYLLEQEAMITDLLKLAVRAENTKSAKVRQVSKMKAGKIRKQLNAQKQY